MKKISIVIPVYNSGGCVARLTDLLQKSLKGIPYEQIMINDGSRDDSWIRIKEIAGKNKNVTGINLRKNFGQDNAIIAGLNHATGEYVVIMDDDLQHNPADIPKLYAKVIQGYDLCYANFRKKNQALWKNIGSWVNGKIAEFLIEKPSNIYLSPFKIVHIDVVKEVIKYKGPHPYIDGLLFQTTNSITQIDIDHHRRFKGKSNYNLFKSIKVFVILAVNFSVRPLRFAAFSGFLFSAIGFLIGTYYLIKQIIEPEEIEGWTTLVVLLLFLGGLILLSLGIIGEYLGKTYLNLNSIPQFVVKEKTGASNKKIF
jgi:undecaprenyl-phosphate 4-deoxy-4-formamido-L-arabinose transferase